MSGALCAEPDPQAPDTNEPCMLSTGHGREVPHLWLGEPCRHFATSSTESGPVCLLCDKPVPEEVRRDL